MNPNPEKSFQRKFAGNTIFYRASRALCPPFVLQRNLRRFLLYNNHQIRRRQVKSGSADNMNSSRDFGRGPTAPYYSVRENWSIKLLEHSLQKGIKSTDEPVLRLDVTNFKDRKAVFRKSISDEEPPTKRMKATYVHAQCLLTIWQSGSSKKEDPTYLVKQSRSCTIEAGTKDSGERTATISMQSPFFIKKNELEIKGRKPLNGYNNQLYDMQLTILPANESDSWPPFDCLSPPPRTPHKAEADGLVRFPMLLAQWRRLPHLPESSSESLLEVFAYQDMKRYKTKLSLKIDAAWSSPSTPLVEHNVQLRKSSTPAPHLPSPVSEEDPGLPRVSVQWIFQGSWNYIHPLEFEGYLCPLCDKRSFSNMDHFHFHLITSHDLFKFELVVKAVATEKRQQRITVQVLVDATDTFRVKAGSHVRDDREMEWQRPQSLFDLEAFLKGDRTWPGNESRKNLRLAPPRTKLDTFELGSSDSVLVETPVIVESRPAGEVPDVPLPDRRKFSVPPAPLDIKFFRLTVKRPLQKGENISESDDEIDESWLIQRHGDTIDSFSDISQSEKQFIRRYDAHMLGENLSSNLHFREALVRFCRINREWLQEKSMKREFHKNAARLLMQQLISPQLLRDCISIIGTWSEPKVEKTDVSGELLAQLKNPDGPKDHDAERMDPVSKAEYKSQSGQDGLLTASFRTFGGCTCGSYVIELRDLIRCSNLDCVSPDYHLQCIGLTKREPKWLCPKCEKVSSPIRNEVRLVSPEQDQPALRFGPVISRTSESPAPIFTAEGPRTIVGNSLSMEPMPRYTDPPVSEFGGHTTDETTEYVEDSDVYEGCDDSEEEDDDEDMIDPDDEEHMLLDDEEV